MAGRGPRGAGGLPGLVGRRPAGDGLPLAQRPGTALDTAAAHPAIDVAALWPGLLVDQHEDYWLLLRAASTGARSCPMSVPMKGKTWLARTTRFGPYGETP